MGRAVPRLVDGVFGVESARASGALPGPWAASPRVSSLARSREVTFLSRFFYLRMERMHRYVQFTLLCISLFWVLPCSGVFFILSGGGCSGCHLWPLPWTWWTGARWVWMRVWMAKAS